MVYSADTNRYDKLSYRRCGKSGLKLPPVSLSDDSKPHLDNWIDCIRSRNQDTNGNIHTGFWHSVGSIMATQSYREGKKLYWDRDKEEIVEQPII